MTEESIVDAIDGAEREAAFVIVDLEGTASLLVAKTIGMADFVVIPTQGSSMDAKGAAKTIRLIRNSEKLSRRRIAHAVLLTRTGAAVTSRALRNVAPGPEGEELRQKSFAELRAGAHEREKQRVPDLHICFF